MTTQMQRGNLKVLSCCPNTIREIETYSWDPKAAERGEDKPLKRDDHTTDALRYAMATHKIRFHDEDKERELAQDYLRNKYSITRNY